MVPGLPGSARMYGVSWGKPHRTYNAPSRMKVSIITTAPSASERVVRYASVGREEGDYYRCSSPTQRVSGRRALGASS